MTRRVFGNLLTALTLSLVTTVASHAGPVYPHLYVGVDTRQIIPSGTYSGLQNPNANRLSFLYAHTFENPATNHFHGIGLYSYTGSAASPTIVDTSTNNAIPEPYADLAGEPPLSLKPGTGAYAGRFVSSLTQIAGREYEGLEIRSFETLSGSSDPGVQVLYNSGNARYDGLAGASVVMELLSISTGLQMGDEAGNVLLSAPGQTTLVGNGNFTSFRPVFSLPENAALGRYSAEVRLRDTNGLYGDSGRFSFIFEAPGTSQANPVLPNTASNGLFTFNNAQSGAWFDPPLVGTYEFTMTDSNFFTDILSLPVGIGDADDLFTVSIGNTLVGTFAGGAAVNFATFGFNNVTQFTVSGIDPLSDAGDPTAFPIQLGFSSPTASFTMRGVVAPEPGTFALFGVGLAGLVTARRSRRKAA